MHIILFLYKNINYTNIIDITSRSGNENKGSPSKPKSIPHPYSLPQF